MTSKFSVAAWTKGATTIGVILFVLLASLSFGQQLTGTLNGTIVDSGGAVVPNSQITFKNEASGDMRNTVSNGSGYFSITAIPPGSYTISIAAQGFKTWRQAGVTFNQGDSRTLPNITLQVGDAKTETVEITAGAEVAVPDNAEVSTTLNTHMVQDLALAGRDAGELLKLMPGMALTNGIGQGSSFNTKTVGTNTGPVGSYSSNGTQPNGAMAFMLDGANLVDPGNAGTQIANINQDMVAEVKVLMSSYSAEYAKGPTIFQAISKSGGSQFHGEGYMYARNSVFNGWDYNAKKQYLGAKANGTATPALLNSLKPDEHFYYYGGNVGGPVRFPFTGFNKNKDKMFFWVGYEYMNQHPAGNVLSMLVPTQNQLAGDLDLLNSGYTQDQINGMNGVGFNYSTEAMFNRPLCATSNTSLAGCPLDPTALAYAALYPAPNVQPSKDNGWNNYQYVSQAPQNRYEITGKVDYAFSDNTKLTVSYTRQIENDQHPVSIWWAPNWTLPYPGGVQAATISQDVMSNFTHVFNASTTNEFVFTYARYINPSTLSNPDASDRTKIGIDVGSVFGHTAKQMPQLLAPWGGAMPDFRMQSFDGGFGGGSAFGATKRDPALYDNFTKVLGAHTIKTGFYWDSNGNIQSNGGNDNGTYNLGWGPNSSGNVVADFLQGGFANYQEASAVPVQTLQYHTWAAYAQDSFKANRQLTLNYGVRFDHLGQWYGGGNNGFQVWDPATYVNGTVTDRFNGNANPDTGLTWNARNSSIPLSGFKSPWAYIEPRAGLAYDIFGTGKTVLRAGFAVFRYQFAENDVLGAANGPAGIFNAQTPGSAPINATSTTDPNGAAGLGMSGTVSAFSLPTGSVPSQNGATGIQAMLQGDNQTPRVADWNITVSQALPWRSVFELSYVANKSTGELINGSNDKIGDVNAVGPGSYFRINPTFTDGAHPDGLPDSTAPFNCTGSAGSTPLACAGSTVVPGVTNATLYGHAFTDNDRQAYRPLTQYGDLYVISHGGYANYNSLQASWQKQSGPITFLTNYTFSKVLGTRDGQTDNGAGNGRGVDPFNLKANYGPLAYDHTHILNLSYVWNMPKFVHGSKVLGGAINGWQLSGWTTYQSGAPIQPNTGGNLNANFAGGLSTPLAGTQLMDGTNLIPENTIVLPNGLRANNVSAATWYGTDQNGGGYVTMVPKVTCDPTKGLKSGQYFNPNCFSTPAFGQLGTLQMPYMRAPAYFNSDLAVFKNFQINERQKLQFRLSATNWLNHPLPVFALNGNGDLSLNFQQNTTLTIPDTQVGQMGNVCAALGATVTDHNCTQNVVSIAPTNTNTNTTGRPGSKTGSRTLTFSVKYYF